MPTQAPVLRNITISHAAIIAETVANERYPKRESSSSPNATSTREIEIAG